MCEKAASGRSTSVLQRCPGQQILFFSCKLTCLFGIGTNKYIIFSVKMKIVMMITTNCESQHKSNISQKICFICIFTLLCSPKPEHCSRKTVYFVCFSFDMCFFEWNQDVSGLQRGLSIWSTSALITSKNTCSFFYTALFLSTYTSITATSNTYSTYSPLLFFFENNTFGLTHSFGNNGFTCGFADFTSLKKLFFVSNWSRLKLKLSSSLYYSKKCINLSA